MLYDVFVYNISDTIIREIEDLGAVPIGTETEVELSAEFEFTDIAHSEDLKSLVSSGDLVVRETTGGANLSVADALEFLQIMSEEDAKDVFATRTELSNSSGSGDLVDWSVINNIPPLGAPEFTEGVKYRVTAIAAAAPLTPDAGDVYIDTDDQHYYKYNGATWDDVGAAGNGDRVIDLSVATELIKAFDGVDTWTDTSQTADNVFVMVNDDGDGKGAQYMYNGTDTEWKKYSDADWVDHFTDTSGRHNSDQIAVEGTYTNIGSPDDVETAISNIDTDIGALETAVTARSKKRFILTFSDNGKVRANYLYAGNVRSNLAGHRMIAAVTLKGVSAQCETTATGNIRVRKNGVTTNLASLALSADGAQDDAVSVSFAQGDEVQIYAEATSGKIESPVVNCEFEYV